MKERTDLLPVINGDAFFLLKRWPRDMERIFWKAISRWERLRSPLNSQMDHARSVLVGVHRKGREKGTSS